MPLTEQFWENERRRLLAIFLPRMTQMALTGMVTAARQAGIAFDNTLYSKLAENWARTQTEKILRDFVSTDLIQPADVPAGGAKYGTFVQGTGEIVADWIKTPGATVDDLNEKLGWLYDPVRVNAIAVTETTRAFASGQLEAYKAEGIEEIIWRTNRDALVCPVCGPLNNKRVKIGTAFGKDKKGNDIFQPPSHPRCRCWISPGVSRKPKDEPKEIPNEVIAQIQDANTQAAEAKLQSVVYRDFSENAVKEIRKYGEEISIDWRMKLKQEERKSIREYTRNGYSMLNRSLRGNLYEDDLPAEVEKSKQLIAPIDSALEKSKLPDNIRVYRGVNDIFDNVDLESLVGTIYKDNGFVSTSFSDKTSFKSKEYQFEINIPANSKGAYLGSLSAYDDRNELEVLLPRGSRFEIDAIIGNTIKMTLIP